MNPLLTLLARRFRNRPDSEHEQAMVRLVIALLIVVYLCALELYGEKVWPMLLVMLLESVVGILGPIP